MIDEQMKICKDCKYFVKTKPENLKGDCHRFPPQWHHIGQLSYPSMEDEDWCGEWKPKTWHQNSF